MDVRTADGAGTTLKGMVLEPGRLRLECSMGGLGTVASVIDNTTKQSLFLFDQFKAGYRFDKQEEEKEASFLNFLLLPGRTLEDVWSLRAGGEQRLGSLQIDGRPAEGFRVTERNDQYMETISIYVDVETRLPAKVEVDSAPQ